MRKISRIGDENHKIVEMDKFLKAIGMWSNLEGFKVPEDELPALAKQCLVLPDYESNPQVATLEEVSELLDESYKR
jgi:alcohol dehydrogenase class IV